MTYMFRIDRLTDFLLIVVVKIKDNSSLVHNIQLNIWTADGTGGKKAVKSLVM